MIKNSVTLDETIEYLNELIKLDRVALRELSLFRVECNKDLADHSTIQVKEDVISFEGGPPYSEYHVGLMGLMNGLFGVNLLGQGNLLFIFDDNSNLVKVCNRE